MTQAYNLAILANAVDSSGKLNVATNSTGVLPVANGGTGQSALTANNVVLGNGTSGVQFVAPSTNGNVLTSNGTTWVSSAPAGGGVTSAVAGNGISVSGATGAVTFSVACPTFNTVGSYCYGGARPAGVTQVTITSGSNYSAGSGLTQMRSFAIVNNNNEGTSYDNTNNLSGTWKWMASTSTRDDNITGLICRVS